MSSHSIALNFEDGVTRIINCQSGETVLDAAYRAKINLPMDCSDGVCGTCKCRAESGRYDLSDDYIEDALTADEAAEGLVLTCQMRVSTDCVLAVPTTSAACKTGQQGFAATVASVTPHGDAAFVLDLEVGADAPAFLPGEYANIAVPGSAAHRSYSFTTPPGAGRMGFLIKTIPGGLMSGWLARAKAGDTLALTGPLGSFYLRDPAKPLLFLAGGTGLAPFLARLEVLAQAGSTQNIHLVYGVTRDADLVLVDKIAAWRDRLPGFDFTTVVADPATTHPRKGWVTQHMPEGLVAGGFDLYLCGPPPMVDAVRRHLDEAGLAPASFPYEKFTPNEPLKASA